MAGIFEHKYFSDINLQDPFFDSLKGDYPEFESEWFPKCVAENRQALVFSDEYGLGAFLAMKYETEPITMVECELPAIPRLKVSTLKLAPRFRGQRLGEGALGLILWKWQASQLEEIYVTVFPNHTDVATQLTRFGFNAVGHNMRGESVYLRSRKAIDFSDPYRSFPFISPHFRKGGYLIVEDNYHDTLFPYSELKNTFQEQLAQDAANGVSKVYIGQQWQTHYQVGEPVFIYRKSNGPGQRRYRSCLTSYCVITNIVAVKRNNMPQISFSDFIALAGNRTVFPQKDLMVQYQNDRNITLIQMLYCGFFGAGNNVNMDWLDNNSLWNLNGDYPATTMLTPLQCESIWRKGNISINNVYGR